MIAAGPQYISLATRSTITSEEFAGVRAETFSVMISRASRQG